MTSPRLIVLAVVSGLAWLGSVVLIATQAPSEPVGTAYDAYNRVLTVALVLLVVVAVGTRARLGSGPAPTALVLGLILMLAGNALEFWGALLAGQPPSATAQRLGVAEFWGSTPGFIAFLIGQVIATVSLIVIGIRSWRRGRASAGEGALVAGSGIAMTVSTALWAVSAAAAAVPAIVFGFGWLALARVRTGGE
jgi:hypothetical protein